MPPTLIETAIAQKGANTWGDQVPRAAMDEVSECAASQVNGVLNGVPVPEYILDGAYLDNVYWKRITESDGEVFPDRAVHLAANGLTQTLTNADFDVSDTLRCVRV